LIGAELVYPSLGDLPSKSGNTENVFKMLRKAPELGKILG
jgi:hypothetical protein